MSVEKTFKGVRLSDEELLVIQNIQEKYGLSNFSQTISYLIREYPHLQEENEMDLCQYFEHKKLKGYADFFNSSSSFCCGVI